MGKSYKKETASSPSAGKTEDGGGNGKLKRSPKEASAAGGSGNGRKTTPLKPANSKLTKEDIEFFHDLLLAKRQELAGDVGTMKDDALNRSRKDAAGDLSSMPIHMADLGTDNYEQEFTLGLIQSEQSLLKEIDEALDRINQGIYGICLATGKPIGKPRLKLKPWAKYSVDYEREQEPRKK